MSPAPPVDDLLSVAVRRAGVPLAAARALEAWLALGLLENRHVGLDGAAIDPRDRIRLAEVFVDVAIGTDLPHWDETISEARLAPGALAALLTDRGSQNHRQKTVPAPDRPRTIERVVVVGGPGQGKSTLVQQLVQVHRAAWIEARRDALDEADRDTLDRVLARCGPDTWARPPVPRLPFLVALGALSSWRAGSPGGARLVDYLTAQVAQGGGVISAESLTALLRATPWLIVLDGLDEVPASAGRAETLAMVERFLRDLEGAPGLVVGTTRPRGYHSDFGEGETLVLAPFSTERALAYAERLVAQWLYRESGSQERVLSRLREASREDGTAQLLGTPLHVTLLAVLLYQRAQAPRERWRLFDEFYRAVYSREIRERDRSGGYGELLRDRRSTIHAVHMRAGLHLQCLGERVDGAEALLTEREFERIIDAQLQDVGVPDRRRGALVQEVLAATTERLVLLAQVRAGRYGFDLRSLQEFMAAQALCNGSVEVVEARVRRVAALPYWRNVVLLAVSYAFTESIDALERRLTVDLCTWLNESPELPYARQRRRGATLALEILEEGSVAARPGLVVPLVTLALETLELARPETKRVDAVMARLTRNPDVGEEVAALLEGRGYTASAEASAREVPDALAEEMRGWPNSWGLENYRHIFAIPNDNYVYTTLRSIRCAPVSYKNAESLSSMPTRDASSPLAWIAEFLQGGDATTLSRVMRRFASEASPELWRRCVDCAPWPLGACLRWSSDSAALRTLADAADRGELGDRADWDAAEKRWVNHGVRLDELLPRESARPFTRSIREEGFLPDVADFAASWHWEDPVTSEAQAGAMGVHAYVQAMLTWRAASSEHRIPSWFADSIEPWDLMMYPGKPILTAPELRVVLRDVPVNFSQVRVFLGKPCADDTGLLAELIEEFPHHLTLDEAFWRDEQASAMLDPERWNALGLPRPSPPAPMGLSPDGVERILGVEVTNLRLFDALTLELSAERSSLATRGDPEAPWLVLLGENSVGKTTLLRSLALALVDPADATAMLTEARAAWRREDTQDATVTVRLPGQSYSVTITSGETERESLKSRSEPANGAARERPFVVGYGCRRGAADGGRDQKVVVERLDDIGTLFDAPGRALVLAEAWLKDLELASLKNETGTAHLFEVVREVLVGDASTGRAGILPGVDALEIRDGVVRFTGPAVGPQGTPLAALSDGYITTTGWVIDMMARWVHRQRVQRKLAVPRRFHEEMTGFALVDEIDLHLHPRWQREVIPTVRRAFPRMSFVVTTHNPLTLVGAAGCEVQVLRRTRETGRVEARALGLPVGLRADQVLTGEWFGLATTLDPETVELWDQHYRALRSDRKAGDPTLQELERKLAKRLGAYATTAIDRIALDAAAKVMGERPQELTPEQRAVAFDRILAFVREEAQGDEAEARAKGE